ncbi:MAG: phosphopantetheine-binding protein [Holophagales bacterium]|nr:phosphopantetheine-binding protein [Holophagales bacterium]
MDRREVTTRIGEIIEEAAGIPPDGIGEETAFIDDLRLDSLSLLQVAVDVDYAFRLDLPEEELLSLRTVGEVIDLIFARRGNATALRETNERVA